MVAYTEEQQASKSPLPKLDKKEVFALQWRFGRCISTTGSDAETEPSRPYGLSRVLGAVEASGGEIKEEKDVEDVYYVTCPLHKSGKEDHPSMKVMWDPGTKRVLLSCFPCKSERGYDKKTFFHDALKAWGLKSYDLKPPVKPVPVAWRYYHDKDGEVIYRKVRMEPGKNGAKKFYIYEHQDDNGNWVKDYDGEKTLFHLPYLINTNKSEVFLVESEGDVLALEGYDLVATTSGGAESWRSEFAPYFKDKRVVILPDADEPGQNYANNAAHDLFDVAKSVRIIRWPDGVHDAEKYFANGGTKTGLRRLIMDAGSFDEKPDYKSPYFKPLSEYEFEELNWLWPQRVPLGAITLLAGDGGVGKSLVAFDIAARVTTGACWPNSEEHAPKGTVVIMTSEDSMTRSVKQKMAIAKADTNKFRVTQEDTVGRTISDLLQKLDEESTHIPDVKLVIIDPITSYMGGVNTFKDDEVRVRLDPLNKWAEQRDIAVIVIMHHTKNEKATGSNRIYGSVGFVNAARSVFHVVKANEQEDDDGPKGERFLVPSKANWADVDSGLGFYFLIQEVPYKWDDKKGHHTVPTLEITWGSALAGNYTDLMTMLKHTPTKKENAEVWLEDMLVNGRRDRAELLRLGKQQGFSKRTLERVKVDLKVKSESEGCGKEKKTWWSLPDE